MITVTRKGPDGITQMTFWFPRHGEPYPLWTAAERKLWEHGILLSESITSDNAKYQKD